MSASYSVPAGDKIKVKCWTGKDPITLNDFLNATFESPEFLRLQRSLRMYAKSEAGKAQLQQVEDRWDELYELDPKRSEDRENGLLLQVVPNIPNDSDAVTFAHHDSLYNMIEFSAVFLNGKAKHPVPDLDRAVATTMMHEVSHALDDNKLEGGQLADPQVYETEAEAKLQQVKLEVELWEKSDETVTTLSPFAWAYRGFRQQGMNADFKFKNLLAVQPLGSCDLDKAANFDEITECCVASWRGCYAANDELRSPDGLVRRPLLTVNQLQPPAAQPLAPVVASTEVKPSSSETEKSPTSLNFRQKEAILNRSPIQVEYQGRTLSLYDFLQLSPPVKGKQYQQLHQGLRQYVYSDLGAEQLRKITTKKSSFGNKPLTIVVGGVSNVYAQYSPEDNKIIFSGNFLNGDASARSVATVMIHEASHALDDDKLDEKKLKKPAELNVRYQTEVDATLEQVKLEVELWEKDNKSPLPPGHTSADRLSPMAQQYRLTKSMYGEEYADDWCKWYWASDPTVREGMPVANSVLRLRRRWSKEFVGLESSNPLLPNKSEPKKPEREPATTPSVPEPSTPVPSSGGATARSPATLPPRSGDAPLTERKKPRLNNTLRGHAQEVDRIDRKEWSKAKSLSSEDRKQRARELAALRAKRRARR